MWKWGLGSMKMYKAHLTRGNPPQAAPHHTMDQRRNRGTFHARSSRSLCGKGADSTDELSQSINTELPPIWRDAGAGGVQQDTRWEKQIWGSDWNQVMWNGATMALQYQRGFNSPEQKKGASSARWELDFRKVCFFFHFDLKTSCENH